MFKISPRPKPPHLMNKYSNFFSHSAAKGHSTGRHKRLSFFLWVRDCALKQFQRHVSLTFCAVSLVPLTAHAADFTVDTLSDIDADGDTLREAIAAANSNAEADTISFASGLMGTLTLTQGELDINADLEINGPEERITISGDDASRIFDISVSAVSLSNLILTEGNSGIASFGGAVRVREAQLTLTNCEVSNSFSAGDGGGIGCEAGGDLTLNNSVVFNNVSETNGGGVSTRDFNLTLTNCEITNNTSEIAGGGIFARIDNDVLVSLALTNCQITDNSAMNDGPGVEGGGVSISDFVDATVSGCTISRNRALSSVANEGAGGGISASSIGNLAIVNGVLSNNESSIVGGGISSEYSGNFSLSNSTISENQTTVGGGILSYSDTLATLTNCTIVGNSVSDYGAGGGIYTRGSDNFIIDNCSITGNSSDYRGGGIYAADTFIRMWNSISAFNTAPNGNVDLFLEMTDLTIDSPNLFSDSSSPGDFGNLLDGVQIIESDPTNVFANTLEINGITTGTLTDNGGPVPTLLLLTGGSAHNAGSVADLASDTQDLDNDGDITENLPVDARGFARVSGPELDLGAVEIDESSPLVLTLIEVDEAGSAILSFELTQTVGENENLTLSRSTDLESFDSIFVFNGIDVEEEESGNTSSFDAGTNTFTIIDTTSPQPKAFYRLEIAPGIIVIDE